MINVGNLARAVSLCAGKSWTFWRPEVMVLVAITYDCSKSSTYVHWLSLNSLCHFLISTFFIRCIFKSGAIFIESNDERFFKCFGKSACERIRKVGQYFATLRWPTFWFVVYFLQQLLFIFKQPWTGLLCLYSYV